VAEIAADFMTTFYGCAGRRTGDSGVAHDAGSVLARLFIGHHDRPAATDVLRCRFAGWQSCGTERVEAVVVVRNHPFVGDSFRVVVSTRKGSEQKLAKGLDSNRSKSTVLNSGIPGVMKISFHVLS
jgi:hypothetical protein